MQTLEFGQRFLNYKAFVKIINKHTEKTEFKGMFVDVPYRLLRFSDITRCAVDEEEGSLNLYITSNSTMFFNTQSHFIEAETLE